MEPYVPRMLALLAIVSLGLLPDPSGGKFFKTFAGPYWVTLQKFSQCPDGEVKDPLATANARFLNIPKMHTEPQRLSINVSLLTALADNVTTTLDLETWANNEWKKNSIAKMTFRRCGCACFRNLVADLSHKLFAIDPKSTGTCVIDKGDYGIVNSTVDWKFTGFPEFIYGLYRGKLTFLLGKRNVFCCIVEARVNALPV